LIATLSLGTFALAQPMASNMGDAQNADRDFYSQNVGAQAEQNSIILSVNALSASPSVQSESLSGNQPGSMASDTDSQSADRDFYSQTITEQANANRVRLSAKRF
jgi:hypothetical protein